jgi:hypothetical protein
MRSALTCSSGRLMFNRHAITHPQQRRLPYLVALIPRAKEQSLLVQRFNFVILPDPTFKLTEYHISPEYAVHFKVVLCK